MERFSPVLWPSQASGGGKTDFESREMRLLAAALISILPHGFPPADLLRLQPGAPDDA
jgi:hypothetical protein